MKNINIGDVLFDEKSGNFFRVDSEYLELQNGYMCSIVYLDENGNIEETESSSLWTRNEVERCL